MGTKPNTLEESLGFGFLLESTAVQRHHKHLESCAIFTGDFKLLRPGGLELLEETLFLFSLPASSSLLCCCP